MSMTSPQIQAVASLLTRPVWAEATPEERDLLRSAVQAEAPGKRGWVGRADTAAQRLLHTHRAEMREAAAARRRAEQAAARARQKQEERAAWSAALQRADAVRLFTTVKYGFRNPRAEALGPAKNLTGSWVPVNWSSRAMLGDSTVAIKDGKVIALLVEDGAWTAYFTININGDYRESHIEVTSGEVKKTVKWGRGDEMGLPRRGCRRTYTWADNDWQPGKVERRV